MERLTDYPGLADRPDYFERAYRTDGGDVARIRFRPVQVDPALQANMPLVAVQVTVFVSASLVDQDGQVLQIGGRGLVADARSHAWSFQGDGDLDMDAWLDQLADDEAKPLCRAAKAYRAFPQLVTPPPVQVAGLSMEELVARDQALDAAPAALLPPPPAALPAAPEDERT